MGQQLYGSVWAGELHRANHQTQEGHRPGWSRHSADLSWHLSQPGLDCPAQRQVSYRNSYHELIPSWWFSLWKYSRGTAGKSWCCKTTRICFSATRKHESKGSNYTWKVLKLQNQHTDLVIQSKGYSGGFYCSHSAISLQKCTEKHKSKQIPWYCEHPQRSYLSAWEMSLEEKHCDSAFLLNM